jgi:hypothetical protein
VNFLKAILILAFFCSFTTLVLERWISSKFAIVIVSAILGAVFFQIGDFINLGFLDPFYQIAFAISLVPAIVISYCVLLLIRKLSKNKLKE